MKQVYIMRGLPGSGIMTQRGRKKQQPKPEVHNNTSLSPEQIEALPVLGMTVNNWRQRNITLRQHPSDETRLISVGTAFDGRMTVIADEPRDAWTTALQYAARGQVYTSN